MTVTPIHIDSVGGDLPDTLDGGVTRFLIDGEAVACGKVKNPAARRQSEKPRVRKSETGDACRCGLGPNQGLRGRHRLHLSVTVEGDPAELGSIPPRLGEEP